MTRINCNINPSELTKKHLMAEHREIKRVPNCIKKGRYSMKGQPNEFTLGKGHVKFFYNKLLYLKKRYEELYKECIDRHIKVQYYGSAWDNVPKELMNDYIPREKDAIIVSERIRERLQKK